VLQSAAFEASFNDLFEFWVHFPTTFAVVQPTILLKLESIPTVALAFHLNQI
jgi:hypothetical protein